MIFEIDNFTVDALNAPADIDLRIGEKAAESKLIHPARLSGWEILSRSVDSRRGTPKIIYHLRLGLDGESPVSADTGLPLPEHTTIKHPLVIGTGPAGIFGALALAAAGAEPVIIDRGAPVENRYRNYLEFLRTRTLNEEDNLLLGEGGAGAFSDGKLYTGTRKGFSGFILRTLVECGAPPEILYLKRPHIGSDRLRAICPALRKRIEASGGIFRFGTAVKDLRISDGKCTGVILESGEYLEAPAVLAAPGLGGRELIRHLYRSGTVPMQLKPFQIGCRIEHPQTFIDRFSYHILPRPVALGAAEYHLAFSAGSSGCGVSSFCMCPGGEIVNATAWRGHSCTNGMSDFARNGEFGNSCLITTVQPQNAGSADEAFAMLENLERRIFTAGGGDYTLPAQSAAAFLNRQNGYNGNGSCRLGTVPSRLDTLIPDFLFRRLGASLQEFDRRHNGFIRNGQLIGAESAVSSPLRAIRDRATGESPVRGLWPAGEGFGMAGGIMSAAADGLNCAMAMLRKG